MQEHPVLKSIMRKLGMLPGKDNGAPPQKPLENMFHDGEYSLVDFETRLDDILSHHQTKTEDRIYLIGLESIRRKLGDKWNSSMGNIHETVRSIIEDRLDHHDMHIRYDDTSYLVVFATLSKNEAQIKCAAIGEEILRRLLGRESVSDLMEVKKVRVDNDGQIQMEDLPSIDKLLVDVADRLGRVPEGSGAIAAPSDMGRSSDLSEVRFIFRPLLAMRNKVVSTFHCLPIRTKGNEEYHSSYDVLDDPSNPAAIYELDVLTMQTVCAELEKLVSMNKRSLLALPVHFETLANHQKRVVYTNLFSASIKGEQNRVVFELVGLPDGIPQTRLVELVSAVKPNARAVMARFSLEHINFMSFRTAGLHAVGVDVFSTDKKENVIMKEMDIFVQNARKNQLKAYIHGVRTISLYTAAVAAGFDYIAGHALTSVAGAAEDAYIFQMDTPYLSLLRSSSPPAED